MVKYIGTQCKFSSLVYVAKCILNVLLKLIQTGKQVHKSLKTINILLKVAYPHMLILVIYNRADQDAPIDSPVPRGIWWGSLEVEKRNK